MAATCCIRGCNGLFKLPASRHAAAIGRPARTGPPRAGEDLCEQARALGNVIASRWVGHFLLHGHDHRRSCPCHRVVRARGILGGYMSGDILDKAQRLRTEGVQVVEATVELARYGFDRFTSARPLEELQALQDDLLSRRSLRSRARRPRLAGRVDVSYRAADEGVVAYALVDVAGGELLWSTTVRRKIRFPYITSYLAYRELPILLELIEQVRDAGRLADMLMVDGSGILHPRQAGVATHLGIVAEVPTVGVTKKLLCGQVNLQGLECGELRPVVHQGRKLGAALRPRQTSGRPLFVSAGHLISTQAAQRLAARLLKGHRLPEPIYWADRLSRAETHRHDAQSRRTVR